MVPKLKKRAVEVVKKACFRRLQVRLRGLETGGSKNFSWCMLLTDSAVTYHEVDNLKKYFGRMENGCIFASAFDEKTTLLKSERDLKRMRR